MSDVVLVAIIAAFPGAVAAVGALILGLRNRSLLRDTHELVNGQSKSLRRVAKLADRRQGEMAGRAWQRRQGDKPEPGAAAPQGAKIRRKRTTPPTGGTELTGEDHAA